MKFYFGVNMKKIKVLFTVVFLITGISNLIAQNSFTNPVLYTVPGSSNSYSNDEGGTTTFNGTFDQKLYSVINGTDTFRKAPVPAPVYRIVRSSVTAQYTGATFYAEGTRITNGYTLVNTQPQGSTGDDVMIDIFDDAIINRGEDNMFNNNVNDVTHNNVERLDYIFPSGSVVIDNNKQGFIICERGGNDNFKVAIVSSIDGSNRPTAYFTNLVSVSAGSSAWTVLRTGVQTYPFEYEPTDVNFQYPSGTTPGLGTQTIYGMLFKYSDFGISNNTTIYGISVAAGDAPSTSSQWLDVNNFPTNTTGANGGMDFTGITGIYNQNVTIKGTVYQDANGATGGIGGTGIDDVDGTDLYVYLLNESGKIYDKTQPATNGTYSFVVAAGYDFEVMISTEDLEREDNAPTGSLTGASMWVNTGEQYGNNNPAGTGVESGTPNGRIDVTTNFTNKVISNVDFGVEKKPEVYDVSLSAPNPGGANTITCPTLDGDDEEDGSLGSGDDFTIESLPSNATLYYNSSAVTVGQTISSYNPTLLTVDPGFSGAGTIEFNYLYTDAAGEKSDVATATVNVDALTISGTIYDDADGGSVDGTGIGSPDGSQLYAYLVNGSGNVFSKSTVASNGTYSFTDASSNTTYTVRISTSDVAVGGSEPSSSDLPTGWVETRDEYGTNNGSGTGYDATADLNIAVETSTSDVTDVNFGIDERPETYDVEREERHYSSTQWYQVPGFKGLDPEDGSKGQGNTFIIETLPSNATLRYNGTNCTVGQTITNYDSTLLEIDPNTATEFVTFTYSAVDAAGNKDLTPATAIINIYRFWLSGTVYNDGDGGTPNGTGINTLNGSQLYAYLINDQNEIEEKQTIKSDGSYTIYSMNRYTRDVYDIYISTVDAQVGSSAPSTSIPSNWAYTAEVFGTDNTEGTGFDTPANLQIAAGRNRDDVSGVNFGLDQLPSTDDVYRLVQNPGGTTQVQAPTLAGSDPEDGTYGSGDSYKITSLPSNGTLYYNGSTVSVGQTIASYNPALLTIDPTSNGADIITFTYTPVDNAGEEDLTPGTAELEVYTYTISGTIYDDADGGSIDGTAINEIDGSQLYAYLVDGSGIIVEKYTVDGSGNYLLSQPDLSTTYTVRISTTSRDVGLSAPSTSLPSGWVYTDEVYGSNNDEGTGSDATDNFQVAVSRTSGGTNVTGLNFAIDKLPTSDNKTASELNPGGTNTVTCPALTGDDEEDGAMGSGNGQSLKITTIPTNATLYYNGSPVSTGQTITNYTSSLLTVDPTFAGSGTVDFEYAWIDAAGEEDPTPATVSITFSALGISGTVYNDANGSTGGIGGTGINSLDGNTLYAYLYDGTNTVEQKMTVNANGTFSFTDLYESTNHNVIISTTNVNVGQTAPSTAGLPANWVAVGDDYGSNNLAGSGLDGSEDGDVATNLNSSDITDVSIGFNKRPDTDDKSTTTNNPGGTTTIQVPSLTGSDYEDGSLGSGNTFIIKTLPTNGNLYYNGSPISSTDYQISNYDPTKLRVDPTFSGYGVIEFTVASVDAGGYEDLTPADIEITVSDLIVSGTVYADEDGMQDGNVDGDGVSSVGGSQLYAYLVNGSGNVEEKYSVLSNGSYSLANANSSTSYSVVISTTSVSVGAQAPSSANLGSGYSITGECYGNNNGAGSGNESGTANFQIAVTTGSFDVSGVNFGYDALPESHSKVYYDVLKSDYNTSSGNSTYPFVLPLTDAGGTTDADLLSYTEKPGKVSGNDEEEGRYAGSSGTTSGLTFIVANADLPNSTNAILVYNNGSSDIELISNPQASDPSYTYWNSGSSQYEINSFNPNNLKLFFEKVGTNIIEFDYSWEDNAQEQGSSEIYQINFKDEGNPLPITLLSFNVNPLEDNTAELLWITASETNSDRIEIERSTDAMEFTKVGEVKASGNSIEEIHYSYMDYNIPSSIAYYRLKMIDFNGSYAYSKIKSVEFNTKTEIVYGPNPTKDFVEIWFPTTNGKEINYALYDTYGKLIKKGTLAADTYYWKLDLKAYHSGSYILRILNNDKVETITLIKE
jgi:hypothetical protein